MYIYQQANIEPVKLGSSMKQAVDFLKGIDTTRRKVCVWIVMSCVDVAGALSRFSVTRPCYISHPTLAANITGLLLLGDGDSITQDTLLSNMIYYTNSDRDD